jgi:hypothetical protein
MFRKSGIDKFYLKLSTHSIPVWLTQTTITDILRESLYVRLGASRMQLAEYPLQREILRTKCVENCLQSYHNQLQPKFLMYESESANTSQMEVKQL